MLRPNYQVYNEEVLGLNTADYWRWKLNRDYSQHLPEATFALEPIFPFFKIKKIVHHLNQFHVAL